MKEIKAFILFFGLMTVCALHAQIKTPPASPGSKITQTVGLTEITIEYSRPSVKGRDIFSLNGLVPLGQKWRTGANKNTIITFSDKVEIAGKELEKGSYAIFSTPGTNSWTMYLYKDTENWGVPKEWDAEKEAVNFTTKPTKLPFVVESLMFTFDNLTTDGATLNLIWDDVMVSFPIKVMTDEVVDAAYKRLKAGPSGRDYYNLGSYYHETGKDLKQALEFVNLAIVDDAKFWMVRRKSMIQADMGNYKEAIETAKKSKELAQAAGNANYVRMNEKAIAEWSAKKGK